MIFNALVILLFVVSGCTVDTTWYTRSESSFTYRKSGKLVYSENSKSNSSGKERIVYNMHSNKPVINTKKVGKRTTKIDKNSRNQINNANKNIKTKGKRTKYSGKYKTTAPLRLRLRPNSTVMCIIEKGSTVYHTGKRKGKWWQVKVGGKRGWMYSKFLEKKTSFFPSFDFF